MKDAKWLRCQFLCQKYHFQSRGRYIREHLGLNKLTREANGPIRHAHEPGISMLLALWNVPL
jgi:hypothetical protein